MPGASKILNVGATQLALLLQSAITVPRTRKGYAPTRYREVVLTVSKCDGSTRKAQPRILLDLDLRYSES